MQKYYLSTTLSRNFGNSNCLKHSVNNVQSRATIVAMVFWWNFFNMLTRVKIRQIWYINIHNDESNILLLIHADNSFQMRDLEQ